jgi:hypothetical protein
MVYPTPFFVLIDSAGRTGVVLLCCGISIRKSEEKGIEGKLRKNKLFIDK